MNYQELTDLQWQALEPLFPHPVKRGRGKPHAAWRSVLNSILFVLAAGAKWDALPQNPSFAPKSVAHRWYKAWRSDGLLDQILASLQLPYELKFPATRRRLPKRELAVAVS